MSEKEIHGWLVINQFLHAEKYSELYQWFQDASELHSIKLTVKTNAELLVKDLERMKEEEQVDFVLFWDKDIRLAQRLENLNLPVFNNSKAIEMCDDKSYTFLQLSKYKLPVPKTILSPKTYENVGYNDFEFLDTVVERLGLPLVVKECFGSFGWQVYLAKTKEELIQLLEETAPKPLIFQEFISSSFGRDMRIQVVGGEVVASMLRFSGSEDFRANLSIGGKMQGYEPSSDENALAISCCKALNLDFGGVDLLFGPNGSPIVCEVNSNAHFRNIYDCTKVNVADCILGYIKEKVLGRSEQ